MAYTIDYGFTRSNETRSLTLPEVTTADWAVSHETYETGSQRQRDFINITSPTDRVTSLRIFNRSIENIYGSSGINITNQGPLKTGCLVGCSLKEIIKITDDTEGCSNPVIYSPMETIITLKSLKHEAITADVYGQALLDGITMLYQAGVISNNQLNQWLHGALNLLPAASSEAESGNISDLSRDVA